MTRDTIVLFLSLLALFGQIALAATALLFVGGRRTRDLRNALIDEYGQASVVTGFVVAVVATAGSLYLSEGAHFLPCKLCWYQRIAMYPLTIILGIAALRRRRDAHWYAIPLAGVGATISSYHIVLERFPRLESSMCEVSNPCTLIWMRRFGYQTIPTMALTAFLMIIATQVIGLLNLRRDTALEQEP